jgi:putative ABC transport system substrate-binding protein
MDRVLIESFDFEFKSALRNLKSAILASALLLALCAPAEAQQPGKVHRIGYLSPVSASRDSTRREAFRKGLREHGYIRGQNLVIEYRFANGNLDCQNELAAELVRLNIDLMLAGGGTRRSARGATDEV